MLFLFSFLLVFFSANAAISGDLNCTTYNGTSNHPIPRLRQLSDPRLDCSTITTAQCNSIIWRSIIATDCPSACGFCNEGGCVDAVVDCATDISICTTVGMQDFVNTYCQRTCGRCPSSTTYSSTTTASSSSSTCTSYNADSSSHCADWAANGFCTNTFYTSAQRKSYCASTCKIC
ncbi:Protein CBG10418 [Caenorhabditis briggsae]|uniref:Protein CBG10418 n=1 Tax=Caenorhabditis briggsae TaxID=6238 RepID=A8XB59_CAEBR|nr:Protein CBG10418 [Caenorhabditis briggsae]CAP29839.2 Protein CBG10418 [Caenorhabditis briggsae]